MGSKSSVVESEKSPMRCSGLRVLLGETVDYIGIVLDLQFRLGVLVLRSPFWSRRSRDANTGQLRLPLVVNPCESYFEHWCSIRYNVAKRWVQVYQ